jgi:serine/threonine-protein kinase RsbW
MDETIERSVEMTLPMIPDVEISAVEAAGELAREIGLSDEQIDEMTHAIIEACINAREHSCCVDQRIYLRFVAVTNSQTKIDVWITDHGRGFDPDTVKRNRVGAPQTPRKRGWGLQIMEAYMDELEIFSSSDGTTVHMIKYGEKKQS